MKCLEVVRRISAYSDGELEDALSREITRHLGECRECRRALEELTNVDMVLQGMARCGLPAGFAQRVISQLPKGEGSERTLNLPHRLWAYLMKVCCDFYDLLELTRSPSTRTLEEFNDVPASFIGHAYFKINPGLTEVRALR